ncbi:HD domain-containing protein [Methanobrevibacter boviskoreani]|uniref:HD domain-containing protein n=1 Tax=Methanobrevibacter boviskoreani TaxID=1348249 RepID=UPI0023A7A648|nr:HD domain-containing protein [Methanobrevibacter boviskoreani]MCI6774707.1 HD domain-containing protein [Methanobrevibacter boviskoreani]MDY5614315.1 HD domain-containing protein [Methanobrevibacter boviskoreani]
MLEYKKSIRDSINGNIPITELEKEILDYPQFQRLRRIKQLGFTSLIYPGANHSRFEHSIGTMHLASKLAVELGLDDDEVQLVRLAGMLHDIGHGPFSHVSESVMNVKHEEQTAFIIKNTAISTKISENFNLDEVVDIINGKDKLGPIISGELDVDRMDYLIRDSHYTGVAYGVIDLDRIISNLKLEKFLVLDIKGVQAAEAMLVARYFMYPSVYQHHTTRIVNAMFRRSIDKMVESGELDTKKLSIYDDNELITKCKNSTLEYTKDIIERLENRQLFKRIKTIRLNNFLHPNDVFDIKERDLKKAEREIGEDYNIDSNYIFINLPEYPKFDEMKTQIALNDNLYHLNEVSSIVQALNKARFNYPDIALYAPKEYKKDLRKVNIEDYLDLPEKTDKNYNITHYDQQDLLNYM